MENSNLSSIVLSSLEFGPIIFSSIKELKGKRPHPLFVGPHTDVIEAQGEFGILHICELSNNGYTICYAKAKIAKDVHLQLFFDEPSLGVYFSLRSDLDFKITGVSDFSLHDHEYSLLFLPKIELECHLAKGKEYTCFTIHFNLDYLDSISPVIPVVHTLSDLTNRMERREATLIRENHMVADSEIKAVIQNLLKCPYTSVLKEMYIETKVHELLLLALSKAPNEKLDQRKVVISESDIEKIRSVKDHIIDHLDNPGSLKEIARLVGINEFKLKIGFRQVFNTTVFGMLFEEWMQRAVQLLSETDISIEQIALQTGYKSHSNFTAAFKKKFGYPPNTQRSSH